MPGKSEIKQSLYRTLRQFSQLLPVIIAMLLLTSLLLTLIPHEISAGLFGHGDYIDGLYAAVLGSIAAGHPLVSYLLGGELLNNGVGLFAITALIISWVTVGIVQLPAEALLLGSRFAVLRNLFCFFSALVVAFLCVALLRFSGLG
ncbi:MAG: hypothetical protein R6X15_01560 [Pseudomonadota bacterium]